MRKVLVFLFALLAVFEFAQAQIDDDGFIIGGDTAAGNPTALITSPSDGTVVTIATMTVQGQARSDPGSPGEITSVRVTVIDGLLRSTPFQATRTNKPCGGTITCTWTASVRLQPGKNTIVAEATDQSGRESAPNSIVVTYNAPGQTPLVLREEPPIPAGPVLSPGVTTGEGPAGTTQPLNGFEQMITGVGQIPTGAGFMVVRTVIIGLVLGALYLFYTFSERFRRKEIEHLAKEFHKEQSDFKDKP